jgi:hypothetical protein
LVESMLSEAGRPSFTGRGARHGRLLGLCIYYRVSGSEQRCAC